MTWFGENLKGDPKIKSLLKSSAQKLTGAKRRAFEAQTTLKLYEGKVRIAEKELGWARHTIEKGLKEGSSGKRCLDHYQARGAHRSEPKGPHLANDIREWVDPLSQADPHLKTTSAYTTRITAQAIRPAPRAEKNYTDEELPTVRTLNHILNRLGYRLKRVLKTKPLKKIPQVDDRFDKVKPANREADSNPSVLRISIDTKAIVTMGSYSAIRTLPL